MVVVLNWQLQGELPGAGILPRLSLGLDLGLGGNRGRTDRGTIAPDWTVQRR